MVWFNYHLVMGVAFICLHHVKKLIHFAAVNCTIESHTVTRTESHIVRDK